MTAPRWWTCFAGYCLCDGVIPVTAETAAYGAPLSVVLASAPEGFNSCDKLLSSHLAAITLNGAQELIVLPGAIGQAGVADLNLKD